MPRSAPGASRDQPDNLITTTAVFRFRRPGSMPKPGCPRYLLLSTGLRLVGGALEIACV